jgi:hypothetical protein
LLAIHDNDPDKVIQHLPTYGWADMQLV